MPDDKFVEGDENNPEYDDPVDDDWEEGLDENYDESDEDWELEKNK